MVLPLCSLTYMCKFDTKPDGFSIFHGAYGERFLVYLHTEYSVYLCILFLVKMSANLQWQCIRKSSCFVLHKNGITFNTVSIIYVH